MIGDYFFRGPLQFRKLGPGVCAGFGAYDTIIRHEDCDGRVYHTETIPHSAERTAELNKQAERYVMVPHVTSVREKYRAEIKPSGGFRKW